MDGNNAIIEAGANTTPAADPMLEMIERVVTSPDTPLDRLDKLIDLRERQMAKEAEQVFNAAFAAAMAEMPPVKKTGKNQHLRNSYATLDDLIATARPVLSRHGLSLNWQVDKADGLIAVTAYVRHASGHAISTTDSAPADNGKQMNAIQGGGSTQTYLKRYTGFAILGMAAGDEADDDGNAAGRKAAPISAEQFQALQSEIERTDADTEKMARHFKVADLHELNETQLGQALALLAKRETATKDAA